MFLFFVIDAKSILFFDFVWTWNLLKSFNMNILNSQAVFLQFFLKEEEY